jgi:hypothetical protein
MRTTPKKQLKTDFESPAEFLGVSAAAQFLGISEASIRRYMTQRKLQRFKIGSRTVCRRADVLALAVPEER